jgi:sulfur dioxygenase
MLERVPFSQDFLFRQLFDEKSWTYSYLLADTNTKEAVIIDPGETLKIQIYGIF